MLTPQENRRRLNLLRAAKSTKPGGDRGGKNGRVSSRDHAERRPKAKARPAGQKFQRSS